MKEDKQRQFSILGHNLLSGQEDPSGDPLIKMIFSNREVLAWLLPHFISEYRGLGTREIMEKYLPNAKVDIHKIPVHPGEAPLESVRTDNVEDRQLAERTTVFDVVLRLPAPNRPGRSIGVIIDIEVQKNNSPGYPIESCMIYYLCRTVSIQRGIVFAGSDYGDICKCHSIWLCPKLPKGEPPSIDRFYVTGERVYGSGDVAAAKEDYDLIEGCVVRFNNDQTQPASDVIRFLQLLLTNIAPPLERLDELNKRYGLSKTREAEDMCNYSEVLKEEGREEGREKDKLEILEQLELLHFSDKKIMTILKVDAEYLKCLRGKLQEQRAVAMADDWRLQGKRRSNPTRLDELHERYGLSKTREAEDMCNYSEVLRQEGKEEGRVEGREEGREKDKLEILEQLELLHFSDKKIMTILKVDAEYLKYLRGKLKEQQAVAMADDWQLQGKRRSNPTRLDELHERYGLSKTREAEIYLIPCYADTSVAGTRRSMGRNVFRMSDVAIGNFDAVANGRIVVGSNEIAQWFGDGIARLSRFSAFWSKTKKGPLQNQKIRNGLLINVM